MWFEKGVDKPVSDYSDVQQMIVDAAKDGDICVEVGVFVGESIHALIEKKKASKKDIKIFAVDLFDIVAMCIDGNHSMNMKMNAADLTPAKWLQQFGDKCMFTSFINYLYEVGRHPYIDGVLIGKSWDIAKTFGDNSVFYCYIDAGHSKEAVTKDLEAWYPKVRKDGWFCGHDWFSSQDIRDAVTDFAKKHNLNVLTSQSSWILRAK